MLRYIHFYYNVTLHYHMFGRYMLISKNIHSHNLICYSRNPIGVLCLPSPSIITFQNYIYVSLGNLVIHWGLTKVCPQKKKTCMLAKRENTAFRRCYLLLNPRNSQLPPPLHPKSGPGRAETEVEGGYSAHGL